MFVRDWMTPNVATIAPQTRLFAALAIMNERKCRRLPVVDGKKLVGIVTKSDVYQALGPVEQWGSTEEGSEPKVEEVMSKKLLTVSSKEPLEAAAVLMLDNRVSGLPVVDGGKLVGIITETDVFKAMVEILGAREEGGRIVIGLASPKKLLDEISKATAGLAVRSVVTYREKDSWKAVVRVKGREK
jgi:acetoin utilization protein AcuB